MFLFALSPSNQPAITLDVTYRPIANLTYQLDVLGGRLPFVSGDSFEKLWKQEFLKSRQDQAMLDQWRTNRDLVVSKERRDKTRWPMGNPIHLYDPEQVVRGAGFMATSVDDYARRLKDGVKLEKARKLIEAVSYFMPRFETWWVAKAQGEGSAFRDAMANLCKTPKVTDLVGRFGAFYRADMGGGAKLPFVLLYRPPGSSHTSGQQLGQYSVFEFVPGEKPENRIDVVLHELCHYFYQKAQPRLHLGFQNQLLALDKQRSIIAYNLLNEGLATALGNGIVAEAVEDPKRFETHRKRPQSWYSNDDIDRTGKALFPFLKGWLDKGGSLYDPEFPGQYLKLMRTEFGDELVRPKRFMISLVMQISKGFSRDLFTYARQQFRTSSMWSSETDNSVRALRAFDEQPCSGGVLVVRPTEVDPFVANGWMSPGEANELRSKEGLFVRWGERPAPVCIIVTSTTEGAKKWMSYVAEAKALTPGHTF